MIRKATNVQQNKVLALSSLGGRIRTASDAEQLMRSVGRISLTFRDIATWKRRSDGLLIGQGAPSYAWQKLNGKQPCVPFAVPMDKQREQLLNAFSADNANCELDWVANYGQGFGELICFVCLFDCLLFFFFFEKKIKKCAESKMIKNAKTCKTSYS